MGEGTVVLLSHIGLYLLGEIINKLLFHPCDRGRGQQAALLRSLEQLPLSEPRWGSYDICHWYQETSRPQLPHVSDRQLLPRRTVQLKKAEGSLAQNVAKTDFNLSKLSPCMYPDATNVLQSPVIVFLVTSHSAVVCVLRVISAKLTFKQYKSAKIEFHNILAFPHFQTDTLTDRIKCADNKNKIVIFMWRFVADRANTAGHCKILWNIYGRNIFTLFM